jgi:DMSO/TMAO reductase YedYZ heme-binding membrane subunit
LGKNIPFSEFFYILNKSISWLAFTLIGLSILPLSWFERKKLERKYFGTIGFGFAAIHLILNLLLINENRYPNFYNNLSQWNLTFYLVILSGILSFIIFSIVFIVSIDMLKVKEKNKILKLAYYGFLLNLFHPFFLGFQRWLDIETWPFYMPPITMLAFLSGIIFLICRKLLRK